MALDREYVNIDGADYNLAEREPLEFGLVETRRSLTGKLIKFRLTDVSGPIQYTDYVYRLTVTQAQLAVLVGKVATVVAVKDITFGAAAAAVDLFLETITEIRNYDPMMGWLSCTLALRDDNTV